MWRVFGAAFAIKNIHYCLTEVKPEQIILISICTMANISINVFAAKERMFMIDLNLKPGPCSGICPGLGLAGNFAPGVHAVPGVLVLIQSQGNCGQWS